MEVIQLEHMEYENNPQVKVLLDGSEMPVLKSRMIMDQFADFLKQAEEMEKVIDQYVVTDVSQVDKMEKAKKASKALQRIRIDAEDKRVELKKQSLNEGRLIDGVNKVILGLVAPMEDKMNASAKFIQIAEQKQRDDLRKVRLEALLPYNADAALIPLTEMTEEGFREMLATMKAGWQKRQDDAAEEVRKKKIADEMMAKENKRIKQLSSINLSFDGKDTFVGFGVFVSIVEVKTMEDSAWDKMISEVTPVINGAIEQQRKDQEANTLKLKQETESKQKLEREKKDLEDKEAKQKRDDVNAKRRAARAPDKDKLKVIMAKLDTFRDKEIPKMSTEEGQLIADDTVQMINKMIIYIDKKVKSLDE